ncbi:MAG: RNase H family protein [Vicinamibacterales bacterium]
MIEQPIVVFTDGASKRNPGPGGWGVVVVTPDGHVTELGGGAALTTNNKMELTGAIEALTYVRQMSGRLAVYTDSTYVIQGIEQWVHNWKRRGWKTATGGEVLNRDLWEALHALVMARPPRSITWHYVRGHSGIPGNERVDAIADGFAVTGRVPLYDGPLVGYGIPILDIPDDTSLPTRSSGTGGGSSAGKSKGPAYSYLSVVDGTPMRHSTWADCERRVKGRSGARFKKATSAADEVAILKAWNINPGAL